MQEKEVWKDIKGYEGIYQISNHGRLKSFRRSENGYIMKLTDKNGWYFTVNLFDEINNRKTYRIHRLVAKYYIPNPHNKNTVNHKDLDKQNNYYKNLEWATQKENNAHAIKNIPWKNDGMINYNRNIRPKIVLQFDQSGILKGEYVNCKEASLKTGVCQRNIHQVASKTEYKPNKIRKQAGGYIWKYKN